MKTNPFDLERDRASFAKKGQYKKLRGLYKSTFAEIPNLNTPKFWDKRNSEPFNLRRENPMAFDKYKKVANILPKSGKLLNIGVGSGNLERHYFSLQNQKSALQHVMWTGTDIAPKSISTLKKIYPQAVFLKANILALPFQKSYFDAIMVLDVLEHISPQNIFKSLKEIRRVLKRNGILIVSVPLNEGLEEMIAKGINPNAHVRMYTPELIKAELKLAGFKVQKENYLFAFGKNYTFKTLLCKYIMKNFRHPNLVILQAQRV